MKLFRNDEPVIVSNGSIEVSAEAFRKYGIFMLVKLAGGGERHVTVRGAVTPEERAVIDRHNLNLLD